MARYGKATRGQVSTAVRSLQSVDARLLGTILNMTPIKGSDGYESYGYGYYEEDSSRTVELEQIDQSPVDGTLASPNGKSRHGADPATNGFPTNGTGPTNGAAKARRPARMKPSPKADS